MQVGRVGDCREPNAFSVGHGVRLRHDKLEALHGEIDELFAQKDKLELEIKRRGKPKRLPMMREEDAQDPAPLKENLQETDQRIRILTAEAEGLKLNSKSSTHARLQILKGDSGPQLSGGNVPCLLG